MSTQKLDNPEEREHARISASGAHRWLNCPGSAKLEKDIPDTSTAYSREGTLAHSFVELRLKKECTVPKITSQKYTAQLKKLKAEEGYAPEMVTHAADYVDIIKDKAAELETSGCGGVTVYSERRVDLTDWIPEGFGTCDTIIAGAGTLIIVDFKYGKGVPVSAIENPQLKLYALGAFKALNLVYGFETVKMCIVQPRLENGYSEYTMPTETLLKWGESIKPVARKAYDGCDDINAGDWCKFCKVRGACKKRAELMMNSLPKDTVQWSISEAEKINAKPAELLLPSQVGKYLKDGKLLVDWYNDLKAHAEKMLYNGEEVPGWKLVAGRTNRTWIDEAGAFGTLVNKGLVQGPDDLYEKKPLTVAKAETLVKSAYGQKAFDEAMTPYIKRSEGKPTMVEASDKREQITVKTTAAEAFAVPYNK